MSKIQDRTNQPLDLYIRTLYFCKCGVQLEECGVCESCGQHGAEIRELIAKFRLDKEEQ
jgi:hypothetical protein